MRRQNGGDFEQMQVECMLTLIRDILSDKSVTEISYQNTHGAICVKRDKPEKSHVSAIGFQIDSDDGDDYDDEE